MIILLDISIPVSVSPKTKPLYNSNRHI